MSNVGPGVAQGRYLGVFVADEGRKPIRPPLGLIAEAVGQAIGLSRGGEG